MRKIDILNTSRERIGLDTIVHTNKTIDETFEDLGGLSLRDVFETNKIVSDRITLPKTESITNNYFSLGNFFAAADNLLEDNTYFIAWQFSAVSPSIYGLYVLSSPTRPNLLLKSYTTGLKDLQSYQFNSKDYENVSLFYGVIANYTYTLNTLFMINQTALGLENLSNDQMMYYYSLYAARKGITKTTFTLREWFEKNVFPNPFFENVDYTGIIRGDATENFIEDGQMKTYNADGSDAYWQYLYTKTPLQKVFLALEFIQREPENGRGMALENVSNELVAIDSGLYSILYDMSSIGNTTSILLDNFPGRGANTVTDYGVSMFVFWDMKHFDESMTKGKMDYLLALYRKIKYSLTTQGFSFTDQALTKTKFDIAYVNQTIDDPIEALNGYTLRQVFEEGNKLKTYGDFLRDTNDDGIADGISGYGDNTGTHEPRLQTMTRVSGLSMYLATSLELGKAYYTVYEGKSNVAGAIRTFNLESVAQLTLLENQYGFYSHKANRNNHMTSASTSYPIVYFSETYNYYEAYKWSCYELNLFGLEDLTQEQLDYYYNLYKIRKTVTQKYLTYNDIFEKNQLLKNAYDFVDWDKNNTPDKWYKSGVTHLTGLEGIVGFSCQNTNPFLNQSVNIKNGHKYYLNIMHKTMPGFSSTWIPMIDFRNPSISLYANVTVIPDGEWYEYSAIIESTSDSTSCYMGTANALRTGVFYLKQYFAIDMEIFDDLATRQIIDALLAEYKSIRDIYIEPQPFIVTEPVGFGNRYFFKELNKKIYGHETDFENMSLQLIFGVNYNAYNGYNLLMNFMLNNEAIVEYNYGKGVRYTDTRLLNAPKTELESPQTLRSKFEFKRLTPFYTLLSGETLTVKNDHDWDLYPIVEGTVNTNLVHIEMEPSIGGTVVGVKFDFTSVTKPFTFKYNCETKEILINGTNNGYAFIDQSYGVSFLSVPNDQEYMLTTIGITNPKITVKKWVID